MSRLAMLSSVVRKCSRQLSGLASLGVSWTGIVDRSKLTYAVLYDQIIGFLSNNRINR